MPLLDRTDLTERDRHALTRARLAAIVRSSVDAIIGETLDGVITDWNQAAERLYGYTAEEVIGQHLSLLSPPEEQANLTQLVARVRSGESIEAVEAVRWTKDGRRFDVSLSVSPVYDDAGQIVATSAIVRDISAQKQLERELQTSEARFRSLIANATDIITILGPDGEILYVSPPIEHILGYADQELVGRNVFDFVHAEDVSAVWAVFERALEDPTYQLTIEFRFLHADGSWRWLESTGTNLLEDDDVGGFVVNSRDVTARVEAETALTRERDLLRTLMEHLPDAVYIKDSASRFLRLNPMAAASLGIDDPREALGKTDFDFYSKALAREYFADEQQVIATGEPLLNQLEARSADAPSPGWWLTSTVPVRDATGAVIGLVGSGRDITERLRTEEALRESEARQRALLTAMPDMVFRLDRAGTILDYKADRLDDLVVPPEEFLGRTVGETLPADVAGAIEAGSARVLESGRTETVEYALELRGEQRDYEARLVVADGDEVVAVVRDVTERKRADQGLRAALEAAHAANQVTRRFLTMMSHELRTPMQAIMGYAELLLAGPKGSLTPEQAEDVQTIRRGATRLVDLVKQMLDLARLEAGQMDLTVKPVILAGVIEAVRQDVVPQAAAKNLALHVDLPAELPPVLGDELGIYRILLNLVGNAVKFTERGEVRISAEQTEGEVAIAVSDTGIGIADDELPAIFEEFHQAKGGMTRRYEGVGLGLAIARKLAEMMGGRLMVESQPGAGSTFTLHLAMTAGATPPAQGASHGG